MSLKVFVVGASGYIGGAVAALLAENEYTVKGLTRSKDKAAEMKKQGIEPVVGEMSDAALLTKHAQEADIVVNAADSDDAETVKTLIKALEGTDKVLIHTSGSSIVSDQANGEPSDKVFKEDAKFTPEAEKKARVAIDNEVLAAGKQGIRSVVICPCLIYGESKGVNSESQQVPALIKQAIESGVVRCVGRGENTWSTIHIQDLAQLYMAVIKAAPEGGTFFFAESGETTFKQIAEKIREALKIKAAVEEWPIAEASKKWGKGMAVFALGSNSRIRGERARKLGWLPTQESVIDDIPRCCNQLTAKAGK